MCDEAKEGKNWKYPPYPFSPNMKEENLTQSQTGALLQDRQHLNFSPSLRSN
jgi:hypothetical protein